MLKYSDFQDVQYQAAIYTPRPDFKIAAIVREVFINLGDILDGDPEIQSLPKELVELVPPEIPRIIFTNSKQIWRANIALSRVDLFASSVSVEKGVFCQKALELFSIYSRITSATVGRVAFVLTRIMEVESPGKMLAGHFCKESWIKSKALNRPEDFKLHAYKKYKVDDTIGEANSWIKHNVGEVEYPDKSRKRGIIVEQDINTPIEFLETANLNEDFRKHFFKVIPEEMKEILELYYPEEGQNDG